MRQVFVLPADRASPSGGNRYNRRLLAALRRAGAAFSVMTIEGALRDAGRGRPARYWVDSLLLEHVPRLRAAAPAPSQCHVVVHYFPSLDPTAPARDRRAWRRREDVAFACADGFLVTSVYSARELDSRGLGRLPRIVVPPAPVVLPGARTLRRPRGARLLMVANLVRAKGVLAFLEGLHRQLDPGDEFALQVAGRLDVDTDYAARCRRRVETSAVLRGRVAFLGALGIPALRRAYARNAIFVSASRMETFGMALQEARAFAMFVLALDAGHAASHVASAREGEVFADLPAMCARVAQLARDVARRERIMAALPRPPSPPTWDEAAAAFLARSPMPQRRTA